VCAGEVRLHPWRLSSVVGLAAAIASACTSRNDAGMAPPEAGADVATGGIVDAGNGALGDAVTDGGAERDSDRMDADSFYLCGSPPGSAPSEAGSTAIVPNVGMSTIGLEQVSVGRGLWQSGDRLISTESGGGWTLWDIPSRMQIVSGPGTVFDNAGSTFVVLTSSQVEIRSIVDASLQGTFDPGSHLKFGLAVDGSYVWGASTTDVATWSPKGSPLMTHPGAYASPPGFGQGASIVGVPSELRIGGGPAGAGVIEHVGATTGTSTSTPPFSGTFQTWFHDGSRFLSAAGSTNLFVFDASATRLALFAVHSVGTIGGGGNYVFNFVDSSRGLDLYEIGGNGLPAAHYDTVGGPFWSGNTVAFPGDTVLPKADTSSITILQLGTQLTPSTYPLPPLARAPIQALADDSNGRFSVGTQYGVVYVHGTSKDPSQVLTLGCGQVRALSGSTSGTAVVATGGNLFVIDVPSGIVTEDLGLLADRVELSNDGKTLAVADAPPTSDLYTGLGIVALPAGTATYFFPYSGDPSDPNALVDFGMSGGATMLVRTFGGCVTQDCRTTDVSDLSGATKILTFPGPTPGGGGAAQFHLTPQLSPNGAYLAASDWTMPSHASTRLYAKGVLENAVDGSAVGWTDDNHLLVQNHPNSTVLSTTLYDNQGNVLATPSLPYVTAFDAISPTTILSHDDSNIYDVTTGAVLSKTGLPAGSVIAGKFVLSVVGHALVATPY
jgi:hypothetical protein